MHVGPPRAPPLTLFLSGLHAPAGTLWSKAPVPSWQLAVKAQPALSCKRVKNAPFLSANKLKPVMAASAVTGKMPMFPVMAEDGATEMPVFKKITQFLVAARWNPKHKE